MRTSKRLTLQTILPWVMVASQLAWLALIWITKASDDLSRLMAIGLYSLVVTAAICLSPDWLVNQTRGIFIWLLERQARVIFGLVSLTLIIGFVYAKYQRIWPYDEERNYQAAKALGDEGWVSFLKVYSQSDYFANKHPPLAPILYGLTLHLLGDQYLNARLLALLFCLGIVLLTFFLGQELFNRKVGLWGAILILAYPLVVRLGTAVMLDVPVTFFILLAVFSLVKLKQKPSVVLAVLLGLSLVTAILIRYSGLFFLPPLALFLLIDREYRRIYPYTILSFALMGGIFFTWVLYAHSLNLTVPGVSSLLPFGLAASASKHHIQITPAWVLHSNDASGRLWIINSLLTRLPSAIGLYQFPLIFLGFIDSLKRRSSADTLLWLWGMVFSFELLLTLPDHRYFLPVFPALAILSSAWLVKIEKSTERIGILAFMLSLGALFLFVDWFRQAELF
jgi:4-amino-4-deoxy-L-arabinose transferase-like glycosyltransferase